jgi:hypothetical protein
MEPVPASTARGLVSDERWAAASPFRPWVIVAVLTAVASVTSEAIRFVVEPLLARAERSAHHPVTLAWVWLLALAALSAWAMRRLGAAPRATSGAIVLGLWFPLVFWLVVPHPEPVAARYVGIESRHTLGQHGEGRDRDKMVYDSPLILGALHAVGCPQIEAELAAARADNALARGRRFVTWHEGLAFGFDPAAECVEAYSAPRSPLQHVRLCLEVGLVMWATTLAKAMTRTLLPLLFLQILWYAWKRGSWWRPATASAAG